MSKKLKDKVEEIGEVLVALEEKSLEIEYATRGGTQMNVNDSRQYFGSTLHQARVKALATLYVGLAE